MGVFESSRRIPRIPDDLANIIDDLMIKYAAEGYEMTKERAGSGWLISMRKGGMFKSVLGLKSALNVTVEPKNSEIVITAKIGIFGQQAIPTAIMLFVAWPVIVTQLWGMVRQSKLDDEVTDFLEQRINKSFVRMDNAVSDESEFRYCSKCGARGKIINRFCAKCGADFEKVI